ncbi:MAG: type II toxin-antitoxin system VapC family toxin [Algicola sp.]|nr:type II toxin-antitoxin system VapC family toxin [Algicola sp.]
MMLALFDTCILIDYLNGLPQAKKELSLYENKAISQITWMEVMVGTTPDNKAQTRAYLEQFHVIDIDKPISEMAVIIRKSERVKLPDAIIWASAKHNNLNLVTRNTKDFSSDHPGIRVPYQV